MLVVSWRLLACSRLISSWMLTSDSEVTCFSSSIFASSSAMGCSKSRKATAMYDLPGIVQAAREVTVGAPTEQTAETARIARLRGAGHRVRCGLIATQQTGKATLTRQVHSAVYRVWRDTRTSRSKRCARRPGRCAIHNPHPTAPDQILELLEPLPGRAYRPVGAQCERTARAGPGVFDRDRTRAGAEQAENLGQPAQQRDRVGACGPFEHQAPRLLFANLVELGELARSQAPGVAEL